MNRARFAFAAHPDAIADLRRLPDEVRDTALLQLQDLVHGHLGAKRLEGRLEGFHKVYIDPAAEQRQWRMVVQFRDAPLSSAHQREVYLVAAGARQDYAVYRSAHLRTGLQQDTEAISATEARVQAARSRSSLAADRSTNTPTTPPEAARPTAAAPRKAAQR
ncbi:type II toxin-antitoxin system RelE family toxin [Streptomyces caniferus]|uniref:type II toxin-antitoxin system RelE family toxin n=1 Tax=Streptomyces caniferus TaxID=285557 RepID=UPI00380FF158